MFILFMIFVALFVVLFAIPFVVGGFFERGGEWLMYPSMYLNLYLLRVSKWGEEFKSLVKGKTNVNQ